METPGRLRLTLFGGFEAWVGEAPTEAHAWSRRHPRALMCLLAFAPEHRLHREQLMEALWPELDPGAAGNQLRKALHRARRALSDDPDVGRALIEGQGETLSLTPDVWVDVHAFWSEAAAARADRDPMRYETAISYAKGDLLPEDRYEPWVLARAEQLRAELLALLVEHADVCEARGEFERAAASLRRALSVDPLEEEVCARSMRVEALSGRRHEALDVYERLSRALEVELGVEPSPQLQALREELASPAGLSPDLTAELWERVGDHRLVAGDLEGAAHAFRAALDVTSDLSLLVRLHRKSASAALAAHDAGSADRHLGDAHACAGAEEEARLTTLDAMLACERDDLDAAEELARRAVDLAEASGDASDVASAHETMAIVFHMRGSWREGLRAETERLGPKADGEPDLARVFDIHHCIGQYHLYGDGLWQDVEPYARSTLEHAERLGAVRAQAFAWCLLGESLLLQARFDEAAGCLERSGELHASLGSRSGALAWQRLAELQVCRGAPEAAEPFLRRASAIATVSPMARHLWGRIHATAAFAALEIGNDTAALTSVRAASAAAARYGDCPTCSALLRPIAAETFAALANPEGATREAGAAREVADRFRSSAWGAMASTAEGNLMVSRGEPDIARRRFAEAAELYTAAGQPYWADRAASQASGVRGSDRGNVEGTPPP